MSDKPEALRLAAILEKMPRGECDEQAAAELRRLHDLVTEDSILLRRQRDEIAQLGQALKRAIERINELEAELVEQARVNGMGGEREASLMAELERKSDAIQRLWKERDELRSENRTLVRQNGEWQAINAELVEALKHAAECVQTNYLPDKCGHDWDDVIAKAEASNG